MIKLLVSIYEQIDGWFSNYFVFRPALPGGVSLGAHLVCARVAGLTDKQRAMCRSSPAAIAAVGDGLR